MPRKTERQIKRDARPKTGRFVYGRVSNDVTSELDRLARVNRGFYLRRDMRAKA